MMLWIEVWTTPAVKPATKAYVGLVMNIDAAPTTIPPAIGAWMMSRAITLPLKNEELQKAPINEAPIPTTTEIGPLYRLNKLKLL